MKNAKLLLLTAVLLLTLTGCRTRTTVPVDPIPDENGETAEDQLGQTDQMLRRRKSDSCSRRGCQTGCGCPDRNGPGFRPKDVCGGRRR